MRRGGAKALCEDVALKYRMPLIRLHEGGGGSVTGAGGDVLATVGSPSMNRGGFSPLPEPWDVFQLPQPPLALWQAYRLQARSFAFCVMTRENAQAVAGSAVVARALGENLTTRAGGAKTHARNGVADSVAKDETGCLPKSGVS